MASRINTSFTLIPNQKYRRSNRRSNSYFSDTLGSESQPLSTLGNFKALPLEIFQIILRYLSVKDISMLSMVSKTVSQHIINYISTSSGSKRLLLQDFHNLELPSKRQDSAILEHYRSLGLLFKRCTLLLPTRERLKYIHRILAEVSCFKFNGCAAPIQCLGLPCYGMFLQTLTAGWDELECHRVYNFLCELTDLSRKMQTVVCSKPVLYLNQVCEKELYCMDWAVKMMQKVCKVFSTPVERNNFLQSVANAFACVIMEMLQSIMSGDRDEDDRSFLNLFHLVHAQANFHKEVLYLTMNTLST
uniref:F-box only protein 47 n=1 Tax=Panthera onca TaxID=9690 RepID=UPI002953E8DF|nr:F-box only protein 47 [Panthera onca]